MGADDSPARATARGRVVVLLHAHLPFVRHAEYEEFLEERWLFEGMLECYLPLLEVLATVARERLDARLTVSLSPPLLAMLTDELLLRRFERYVEQVLRLAEMELERAIDPVLVRAAEFLVERTAKLRAAFGETWRRDLPTAFAAFRDLGVIELVTCAGTHPVLPLLCSDAAVHTHIETAAREYQRLLGGRPRGMWLPECAYAPGIEKALSRSGVRWFVVDTHGVLNARPRPLHGVYAPLVTPSGVAAFGRDPESSRQVWSASEGYPGDPWYRDFYEDAGYRSPPEVVRRVWPAGAGTSTGVKLWRVTGGEAPKAPYDRLRALERVDAHAAHFVEARRSQAEHLRRVMGTTPVIVCPYDAELFGHWWFEGPEWLLAVLRRIAGSPDLVACTPTDDLETRPALQRAVPAASSWGHRGYHEVWLAPQNDWIYPRLHAAQARLETLARQHPGAPPPVRRALTQALRNLLSAQASDWAFMMSRETTAAYATMRTERLLGECRALCDQVEHGRLDEPGLRKAEAENPIFPFLDYRLLLS